MKQNETKRKKRHICLLSNLTYMHVIHFSAQPWISFENPSHSIQLDDFNLYKQYLNDRKGLLLSKADVKKLYLLMWNTHQNVKMFLGLFSPLCKVPERLTKFLFGAIYIIVALPLFSVPTRHQNPDDFRTIKPLLKSLKLFKYNWSYFQTINTCIPRASVGHELAVVTSWVSETAGGEIAVLLKNEWLRLRMKYVVRGQHRPYDNIWVTFAPSVVKYIF